MMISKKILIVDLILVLGSLIAIAGVVGYARPLVIAPIDDYVSSDNLILFSFSNADRLLIDDNLEFTSPQIIQVYDDLVVSLEPGVYYWKAVGALSSEIRQLTIESRVDLRVYSSDGEQFQISNSGTEPLDVEVYERGVAKGKIEVGVGEQVSSEGDKFIGREDE